MTAEETALEVQSWGRAARDQRDGTSYEQAQEEAVKLIKAYARHVAEKELKEIDAKYGKDDLWEIVRNHEIETP